MEKILKQGIRKVDLIAKNKRLEPKIGNRTRILRHMGIGVDPIKDSIVGVNADQLTAFGIYPRIPTFLSFGPWAPLREQFKN